MIKINEKESYRTPDAHQVNIDDRQRRIDIFGGTIVQDSGIGGHVFAVTAMFTAEKFIALSQLWAARATVTYTDESGIIWTNCRINLKSYKYVSHFPEYVTATFEIWQITGEA